MKNNCEMPKKRGGQCKRVICLETNEIYNSATEAAEANHTSLDMISNVCRGVGKTTKGKTFRYIDENSIPCHAESAVRKVEVIVKPESKVLAKGTHNNGNSNPVLCISTGEVFASCYDAAEHVETNVGNMSRACRVNNSKVKGRKYCYVKDIESHLDEVTESIRKANMYDEFLTKNEKHQQLIKALREAKNKVSCIELEIQRLSEQLVQAEREVENARDSLINFEW